MELEDSRGVLRRAENLRATPGEYQAALVISAGNPAEHHHATLMQRIDVCRHQWLTISLTPGAASTGGHWNRFIESA
jgi:hypothetical protein